MAAVGSGFKSTSLIYEPCSEQKNPCLHREQAVWWPGGQNTGAEFMTSGIQQIYTFMPSWEIGPESG